MVEIVKSSLQGYLEFLVVILLVVFQTNGADIIALMFPNTDLVAIAIEITAIVSFLAYEFLSEQGLAWYKELSANVRARASNTSGSLATSAFIVIVLLVALVVGVYYVGTTYFAVDWKTMLNGLVLSVGAAVVLFFKYWTNFVLKMTKPKTVEEPEKPVAKQRLVSTPFGTFVQSVAEGVNTALYFNSSAVLVDISDPMYALVEQRKADPPAGSLTLYAKKADGSVVEEKQGHFWGGKIYRVGDADVFADQMSQPTKAQLANSVWTEMTTKPSGKDAIEFIMSYIGANFGKSVVDLKLELTTTEKEIADMKARGQLQNFIDNFLPTKWANYLSESDPQLKDDAESLWRKYVPGAAPQ